jgi:muramidase (phage lysozyme)
MADVDLKIPFLDALLYAEGDEPARQEGISPYFILCGGGSFEKLPADDTGFPIWKGLSGSWGISHAAGRAQFEPRTWAAQHAKLSLGSFAVPANQDAAAWDLANSVYKSQTRRDLLSDLAALSLGDIGTALHSTWTSVSSTTFPERYHTALTTSGGLATPLPAPAPVVNPAAVTLVPAFPGEEGAAVKAIQMALNKAGVQPVLAVDSIYGIDTADALRAFQISVDLPTSGFADPATIQKLQDFA